MVHEYLIRKFQLRDSQNDSLKMDESAMKLIVFVSGWTAGKRRNLAAETVDSIVHSVSAYLKHRDIKIAYNVI